VVGTAAGVLGTTTRVVDTPVGVLSTALVVISSAARVVGTSSLASPPLWMTKCSTMKVLVKLPASPVLGLL